MTWKKYDGVEEKGRDQDVPISPQSSPGSPPS